MDGQVDESIYGWLLFIPFNGALFMISQTLYGNVI